MASNEKARARDLGPRLVCQDTGTFFDGEVKLYVYPVVRVASIQEEDTAVLSAVPFIQMLQPFLSKSMARRTDLL